MKKQHWILLGIVVITIIIIYVLKKNKSSESLFAGTSRVAKKPATQTILNQQVFNCTHTKQSCDQKCKEKYTNTPGCPPDCIRTNSFSYTGVGGCKAGDKATPMGTS